MCYFGCVDSEPSIFDNMDEAAEAAADAMAVAEIEHGQFVSHEEVTAWLQSWGTPNKLPTPTPTPTFDNQHTSSALKRD